MNHDLLVYSPKSSPRLEYVVNFFASNFLKSGWRITDNAGELEQYPGPVINYSKNQIMDTVRIHPHKIMFEEKPESQFIKIERWKNLPVFFETDTFAAIPYDILACAFYLLSRYEEYTTHSFDEHGRFRHQASLGYLYGFINRPIVDEWFLQLKQLIAPEKKTNSSGKLSGFVVPTIDIDNAWAIRNKPFMRQVGGAFRELVSGNIDQFWRRIRVLRRKEPDPYDNYSYLIEKIQALKIKPMCFVLFARYGKYDKNIPVKNSEFRTLINQLSEVFTIGLHPSYQSNQKKESLSNEKETLEKLLGNKITSSRQHFLMLRLPKTYDALLELGITDDYSMGYPGITGFRAGTSRAFRFFHLFKNTVTALTIHPFAFMDVTLRQYMRLTPEESIEHIEQLAEKTMSVDGTLSFIWHNESLSGEPPWTGWKTVFESALKLTPTKRKK